MPWRKLKDSTSSPGCEITKMKVENEERNTKNLSKGLLLSFTSGLLLACAGVIVKYLKNMHPGQLTLYRFLGSLALSLPQLIRSKVCIFGPSGSRISVILRSILVSASIYFQFLSFRYLPVGEAAVLISTYPVFVTIAGKFLLKESFGLLHVISLVTTTVGMILITGICETDSGNARIYTTEMLYGYATSIASALCISGLFIITRRLRHVPTCVFMFTDGLVGASVSGIATLILGNFRFSFRGLQQILIIILPVVCYFGLFMLNLSVVYGDAGPCATMRAASDIFLSFVWQISLFHNTPNTLTVVGVVLILVSISLIGFRERISVILHNWRLNSFCLPKV